MAGTGPVSAGAAGGIATSAGVTAPLHVGRAGAGTGTASGIGAAGAFACGGGAEARIVRVTRNGLVPHPPAPFSHDCATPAENDPRRVEIKPRDAVASAPGQP